MALRCCAFPGCPALVERGRCAQHRREHERGRGTRQSRGYDNTWLNLRNLIIAREPCCRPCHEQGRTTLAVDVDHIIPFNGLDDPLRLDPANLRPICRDCHNKRKGETR